MKVKILHLCQCVYICVQLIRKLYRKRDTNRQILSLEIDKKGWVLVFQHHRERKSLNVSASCRETVGESGFVLQESFAQKIK